MAVEIREVVIRAVVERPREPDAPARAPSTSPPPAPRRDALASVHSVDPDAIVAACVREVLRKLERARER